MKKTRILTALLIACATLLCACSAVKEIPSTDEEARVVAMCGDNEIRYEELRYLTMNYKTELRAKYGEDIFDTASGAEYEEELRARVEKALIENYALVALCETQEVRLFDKESRKQVEEYVAYAVESCGGMDAYRDYLAASYMTDWVFRWNAALLGCQERYYIALAEEREQEAYDTVLAGDGFIRCRSIFIQNDPGESVEKNRQDAETVLDAITRGALLEDYIGTRYNQDTSSCDYYFMKGYFLEEYENVAFALEVGEVSPVVETADGFYIIQRVEPDPSYFGANIQDLMIQYFTATMENEATKLEAGLSVTFNEAGNEIVFWSME